MATLAIMGVGIVLKEQFAAEFDKCESQLLQEFRRTKTQESSELKLDRMEWVYFGRL